MSLFALGICCILLVITFIALAVAAFLVENDRQNAHMEKCLDDNTKITNFVKPIPMTERSQTRLVFLAAARNAMKGLPFFLSNLSRIKMLYPNTRLVVIENNSIDDTRSFLESRFPLVLDTTIISPNFTIEKNSPTTGRDFLRVSRMAALRNQLLTYVKDTDDYVIIIDPDWDVCIEGLMFQSAITHLNQNQDTIAGCFPLFMNHASMFPFIDLYFDTFAFQSKEFENPGENKQEQFKLLLKRWPKDEAVEVESAFGVFGIYRRSDIQNIKYSTLMVPSKDSIKKPNQPPTCRCEHVAFNQDIRKSSGKKLELLTWFKIVL